MERVDDSLALLAVQMRYLSEEQCREARKAAEESGQTIERVLLDRGHLTQRQVEELQLALGTTGVLRRAVKGV